MSDANLALDAIALAVLDRVRERLPELLPVPKRVLSLEEAAEYLGCCTSQVRKLVSDGKIRPVEWTPGTNRRSYDVRDLDAAIEAAKRKGDAAA